MSRVLVAGLAAALALKGKESTEVTAQLHNIPGTAVAVVPGQKYTVTIQYIGDRPPVLVFYDKANQPVGDPHELPFTVEAPEGAVKSGIYAWTGTTIHRQCMTMADDKPPRRLTNDPNHPDYHISFMRVGVRVNGVERNDINWYDADALRFKCISTGGEIQTAGEIEPFWRYPETRQQRRQRERWEASH